MTRILLMLFVAPTIQVFTQPIINSSIYPYIGMEFTFIHAYWQAPSAPGPNQTWTINPIQTGIENAQIVHPLFAPGGGQVGGADVAFNHHQVSDFYSFTNGDLNRVATYYTIEGLMVKISVPELVLPLPITYQESTTKNFFGTYDPSGQPTYRLGTIKVEADAYGTLTMMGHTFTDVLRVRVESTLRDSSNIFGNPVVNPMSIVTHYYLKNGVPLYLMYTTSFYSQSGTQQALVLRNPATVDAGNSISIRPPVLYPNPATDVLNITIPMEIPVATRIEIVNTTGQLVASSVTVTGTSVYTINLSHLPPGVYLVRMDWNGTLSTYPFVKQ